MNALCVIPARFGSKRFPGKPLVDLCGKPLIQHVWERVCQARTLSAVVVATDDERIFQAVKRFGGDTVMTSPECASGSDRVGEVMRSRSEEVVVNVQGDEPLIDPKCVDLLVDEFDSSPGLGMATLARPLSYQQAENPNAVKVVCDKEGYALYFSRSRIPFWRDTEDASQSSPEYLLHIGVYAYRAETLRRFLQLPVSRLEKTEKLEQLRALENGIRIKVIKGNWPCCGVDTPEDLEKAGKLIAERSNCTRREAPGVCQ